MAFEKAILWLSIKIKIIYKSIQKSDVFIEDTTTTKRSFCHRNSKMCFGTPHASVGIYYLTDFVLRTEYHRTRIESFILKNYFIKFEVGSHVIRFGKCFRFHWCMKLKHFSINYYKSKQVTKWSHNVLSLCKISAESQLITCIKCTHFVLCFIYFSTSHSPNRNIHTHTHSILPFVNRN